MQQLWGAACLFMAVFALAVTEPTPQPSVEPTTAAATFSSSTTSESSDLTEEGQDQVAILKQINRVNEDGSYTFGYEAADGSFKIETRDVAGNVKGMFGFVDEGGELKRVSYSASNGTGFQSTGSPNVPPLVTPDGDSTTRSPFLTVSPGAREATTRISLLPESTTERPDLPVYIYKSTTRTPRPEVIQHIPKLRPTPASVSTEPTESEDVTSIRRPAYGTVLPRKSSTPNYITLKTTTENPYNDDEDPTQRPTVVQVIRPRGYKRVLVTKRPVDPSASPTPSTTEFYPATYASQLNSEEIMDHGEGQREVDNNSVTDAGLDTSGTEDSPDVFGGGPTARPYPAGAYRTLFPPLPQYQRILETSFLQNQNQYQAARAESRLPPPIPGQGNPNQVGSINPNIPNRYQDPSAVAQFAQFSPQSIGRSQQAPFPPGARGQGQEIPYPPGDIQQQGQGLPYPPAQQRGQGLPYPPGVGPQQGQSLPYPSGVGPQQGQGLPYPPGARGQGQDSPYPPGPLPYPPGDGANGQRILYPSVNGRQYQGLPFPSGASLRNIPSLGPQDSQNYPQAPAGRALPGQYPQQEQFGPFPAQDPIQNSVGRQPQRLPPPTYNPAQGLTPAGPAPNSEREGERRPPPGPSQLPIASYGPNQNNPQSFLMEQLIRMLLAAQAQARPQQQLSPFQQALIATLGPNNVPPEVFGRNYDPRYPNYWPYQPRAPFYPQQSFDPRYPPYSGYPDPYAQVPFPNQYNPYFQPNSNPYQGYNPNQGYNSPDPNPYQGYNPGLNPYQGYNNPGRNPYQGYNPNPNLGYSPNPAYQFGPEEALIRMFLGPRFPASAPQPNPQIQTSPAAFDRSQSFAPRPNPIGPDDQGIQSQIFGQRIPVPGGVVERSSPYVQREDPSQRNLGSRAKGSRNVQILDPVASESTSTTSKPL